MRILLYSAIDTRAEVETRYPDLGLAYLSTSIKDKFPGAVVRIIYGELENEVVKFKPDLIGIKAVSQNYNKALKAASLVKRRFDIPVLMGGIHITTLPRTLGDDMDLAIVGEGEIAIVDILDILNRKGHFDISDYTDVKGIAYHTDGNIVMTEPRERIRNLDIIRPPDRTLLDIKKHTYMFTSRGCPFDCYFCASSRYWENVRFFSAEYVFNEIQDLAENYGVNYISFFDDLFVLNRNRLKSLVELLNRSNLLSKVKFSCNVNAVSIDNEMCDLLKNMNIKSVGFGLESGNDRVLKKLKGERFSLQKNIDAVQLMKDHKIFPNSSFIIGYPDETYEEAMDTYRFIKDNPVGLVDIYVLTPFPGTPAWEYAKSKGLVSENMDWDRLNVNFHMNYKKTIIISEEMNRLTLWKNYKKFMRLRLIKNAKTVWGHPMLIDLPSYLLKRGKEQLMFHLQHFFTDKSKCGTT